MGGARRKGMSRTPKAASTNELQQSIVQHPVLNSAA